MRAVNSRVCSHLGLRCLGKTLSSFVVLVMLHSYSQAATRMNALILW